MAAHTLRTTHRPMPNPPLRLFSGPRSKRSKMTSCLSGGDADAVVPHDRASRRVSSASTVDMNRMAGPEPDGVGYQIATDLVQAKTIPPTDHRRRRRHSQLAPRDGEFRFEGTDDVANHLRQIDVFEFQVDPSGREPRDVEQSIQCLEQSVQTLFDPTELSPAPTPRGCACAGAVHLFSLVDREPDLKHQRRNRIAQFVRDSRDEFVAGRDGALQLRGPSRRHRPWTDRPIERSPRAERSIRRGRVIDRRGCGPSNRAAPVQVPSCRRRPWARCRRSRPPRRRAPACRPGRSSCSRSSKGRIRRHRLRSISDRV